MTTTSTPANLATMTPAEIDTLLAPIASGAAEARARAYELRRAALRAISARTATRYEAMSVEADAKAEELDEQAAPYEDEYRRRGGWSRIYWCQSNGGHAHRSLACSTLFVTTPMAWIPELSGKTEAELVDLAGESACTVCYPSAPAKPSQLAPARQAREEKAARDAELAAKRAAKAEKAITAPDGTPLQGRWGVIATVVTAWKEAVEQEADHHLYGYRFGAEEKATQDRIVEALVAKLGETEEQVRATLAKKVAAKIKRG